MLGQDADSTATTVGSWAGALHGESGLQGATLYMGLPVIC